MERTFFNFLDAYQKESFCWAEKVWSKISSRISSNGLDIEMTSIALASIYNDFLYVSMKYHLSDFENHLAELYGEKKVDEKFVLMHDYRKKIYEAMLLEYGTYYEIYESLQESVLIKDDQEGGYINPMSDSQEMSAMNFVDSGFNY